MIVTFDNKAKEIIKNIVTQSDTPTPEPTPTPSGLKFETLAAGNYKFKADKFLELLIAKDVDVDYENPSSSDEIIIGVDVEDSDSAIAPMYLYFGQDSGYPQLTLSRFGGWQSFTANTKPEEETIKTYLEALGAEDLTFEIDEDLTYIPLFISTVNGGYTRLALTADEIKTFIVAE